MIRFLRRENLLLLIYSPDSFSGGIDWVDKRLNEDGGVRIKKVFFFTNERLVEEVDDYECVFRLGVLEGDYYVIDKEILGLSFDLRIHSSCNIAPKMFIAKRGLSVFRNLDSVLSEPIVIGESDNSSIPESEFKTLLRQFPSQTELDHYVRSRITRILKDYFETTTDAQSKFEAYLNKRSTVRREAREPLSKEYEIEKFEFIRDELKEMLKSPDAYSEKDWQERIVHFLLLLFPKYIAVLENLHIKDFYSNPNKATDRYIDLTLVDVNGHIDIIEIKRPFVNCLVSKGKYRGNFTPKKELSGSVMQVEKYIFHLSKWGRAGEKEIHKKREMELPKDLALRVTNPKGMILLGREKDLDEDQLFDFEFIKRKYSNIIDIMTYDDLLRRLHNIIEMLSKQEIE